MSFSFSPARLFLLALFAMVTAVWPAWAHENHGGFIEGRVVDQDGSPVPYVDVYVEGREPSLADEEGRFHLTKIPVGTSTVVVEGSGVETTRQPVEVGEEGVRVVIEVFVESAGDHFVVVRSPRGEARTASGARITARELAAVPLRTGDDALKVLPGVVVVQHGTEGKGVQLFLRGFDAQHGSDIEVTADGLPINEWSHVHSNGYLDLGFVMPELIRSVDIVKGPFQLGQGPFSTAGSVRYDLGVPLVDVGWRASYSIGTTNRHRVALTWSPVEGYGDSFVGFEAVTDSGFGERRGLDRVSGMGRIRLVDDESGAGAIDLGMSAFGARFELPTPIRVDDLDAGRIGFYDSYELSPGGRGSSERGWLWLKGAWSSEGLRNELHTYVGVRRISLRENFTGFLIDPVRGDWRGQRQRTLSFGANWGLEFDALPSLVVLAKAGLRGDALTQRESRLDLEGDRVSDRRDLDAIQILPYAALGLRWQPVAELRVDAGARFDTAAVWVDDRLATSGDGEAAGAEYAISPRVALRYQAHPDVGLYASYGRGARPPEARAFSSFRPEDSAFAGEDTAAVDPQMTISDVVEAGLVWSPLAELDVQATGFATFVDREQVFDHVSGVNIDLNSTRRVGAELGVVARPLSWLLLRGDATYVDARFVDSGNEVPFAPSLMGSLRAVLTHPTGLQAGLRFVGFSPRPLPLGARGASYASVDATLGYRGEHVRLDLSIENLLDRRLRDGEFHYASDWQLAGEASQLPTTHVSPGPPLNARLRISAVF